MLKAILFSICCVALSCSVKPKNQDTPSSSTTAATSTTCDNVVLIDEKKYESSVSDKFTLLGARIIESCLIVQIHYGGGCGDVTLDLIDAGVIMESEPLQRKIKLVLDDQDNCEALVTKVFTFDISSLKLNLNNNILLRLDGWEKPILY